MSNLKKQLFNLASALAAGSIMFLTLMAIEYFLELNGDLLKKILSSVAAGTVYFIEKLHIK